MAQQKPNVILCLTESMFGKGFYPSNWLVFKIGVSNLNFIIHKLGHFSPSTCSLIFMVYRYVFKELCLFVYLFLILLKEKNVKEKSDSQEL